MIKKYGWRYTIARIMILIISWDVPLSLFLSYMFKDDKDEEKRDLSKLLFNTTMVWLVMELIALIAKVISLCFLNGVF